MPLPTKTEPTVGSHTVVPVVRPRSLPWLLLFGGAIGLSAAFVLMVEKISLLADTDYVPTCSLNPVLNCGSIMRTDQAELFGFPNPILGLVGFSIVTTTGVVLLAGGVLARWYWQGLQVGVVLAAVLVAWLVFQSLYRIGALCPYCMIVWVVVAVLCWYVTLANATAGHLGASLQRSVALAVVARNHGVLLTAGLCLLTLLITARFWDYWSSLV